MHSRIFKVQPELEEEFRILCEEDYYDNGFLDGVGDYVSDDVDLMEDYQWLASSSVSGLITVRRDGDIQVDEQKYPLAYLDLDIKKATEWVTERLNKYREIISKDPKKAYDWETKTLVEGDRSGFYFDIPGWGYMTDMDFMVYCTEHYAGADVVIFRLEGTLDYHS